MRSGLADDPDALTDTLVARASTVAVQYVPPGRVPRFLECQRGLTRAVEGYSGYRGTELYPPADDRHHEWVAVIHFDDEESLRRWIDSPARAEWIGTLRADIGDFRLETLPSGFGAWFAGLEMGPRGEPPPSWKMAMTVLLGLYPTVMVIALLLGPYLSPLGMAVSMLVGNVLSVSLTQWVVIPPLMNALGPWLRANGPGTSGRSFGGLVLIGLLLAGLAAFFRAVGG